MKRVSLRIIFLFGAFLAPMASPAAVEILMSNVTDNILWNSGANWQGGTAPVANDQLVFRTNIGSLAITTTNGYAAGTQFNGISFTNDAIAYTLAGNHITLGGEITNNSLYIQTINLGLTNAGNRTITGSGSTVINGWLNTINLTKTGLGKVSFGGVVFGNNLLISAGEVEAAAGSNITGTNTTTSLNIGSTAGGLGKFTVQPGATVNEAQVLMGANGATAASVTTGIVNQVGGTFYVTNDVRLGQGYNTYTHYDLAGGSLRANNLILGYGVTNTVAEFNMTGGTLTVNSLMKVGGIGQGGSVTNSSGYYWQSGGTATVATLQIAGISTNSQANTGYLMISNGVFSATAFQYLAAGGNTTGVLYFGQGSLVTLPAFPTARGVGSYATLTFDGGALSNTAASTTYLQGLDRAYLTTNGAIFNVGGDITVAQVLEDVSGQSGTLTKNGAGSLTLSGANSYSGGTTFNTGTLVVDNDTALGSGLLTINGNNIKLSAVNDHTLANNINMNTNAIFTVSSGKTLTLNGNINGWSSGSGATFTKQGAGTLTIGGAINVGLVQLQQDGTINMISGSSISVDYLNAKNFGMNPANGQANVLNIQGGSVTGANVLLAFNSASGTSTVNQTSGAVFAYQDVRVGSGTNLTGATDNQNYGQYNLSGGTLTASNLYTAYGSGGSGDFNMSGGTLTVLNNMQIGRNGTITNTTTSYVQSGGTAFAGALTIAGGISNNTYFAISNGVFSAATFANLAPNAGNTTSTLYFGQGSLVTLPAFPTVAAGNHVTLTFDGGTLSNKATSTTYLKGLEHVWLTTNGATFAVGGDITVGQLLEDAVGQAGKLIKTGAGALTLTNANAYTGGTAVNQGTLALTSSAILSGSTVTVASGARLDSQGQALGLIVQSGGLVTGNGQYYTGVVESGGILSPGNSAGTNYYADLTLNGGAIVTNEIMSAAEHDMIITTNSLTVDGLVKLDLRLPSATPLANGQYATLFQNANGYDPLSTLTNNWLTLDGINPLLQGSLFTIQDVSTNTFRISYTGIDATGAELGGSDVLLTVIPEPASVNLLVMLGAAYVMRRRLHRKKSRWNI